MIFMEMGSLLGIIGLVLSVGVTAFWFSLARRLALPGDRTGFVFLWLVSFGVGAIALIAGTSFIGGFPPAIAILISSLLIFTVYVSPQAVESRDVIKVGDFIPSFQATDDKNQIFDSIGLGGHLILIKFFRAHW
jgi:hypothetical protein